mgnify:CR=1 FL=1
MEFEKLKDIIVDVMGCNPDEITMDTTFVCLLYTSDAADD